MATAPDVVEDEMVDTFAPFLPAPTPEEEKPYLVAALTEREEIKTYSRMALAPDEIDDETMDNARPFLMGKAAAVVNEKKSAKAIVDEMVTDAVSWMAKGQKMVSKQAKL